MTRAGGGWDSIKGMERGCPHGSLSIADYSFNLMHLKARHFLERAGFTVDSSRIGPERLI
jgi:hypothetical protein